LEKEKEKRVTKGPRLPNKGRLVCITTAVPTTLEQKPFEMGFRKNDRDENHLSRINQLTSITKKKSLSEKKVQAFENSLKRLTLKKGLQKRGELAAGGQKRRPQNPWCSMGAQSLVLNIDKHSKPILC